MGSGSSGRCACGGCFRCLRESWFCVDDISFHFRLDGEHLLIDVFLEGEDSDSVFNFRLFRKDVGAV